jgi:hypothetical protein
MTIDEAILKISSIGVFVKLTDKFNPKIFGGIPESKESQITIYRDSFVLYLEDNIWILTTPDREQTDRVEQLETLESAVDKICEFYSIIQKKK